LGDAFKFEITPHIFRHYFMTKIVKVIGNLELAKILAGYMEISSTERYVRYGKNIIDYYYLVHS